MGKSDLEVKLAFRRKIDAAIEDYFANPESPILMVDGSRQVGKSYTVRRLGRKHFKNFVEINLAEDMVTDRIFEDIHSVRDFYLRVQSVAGRVLGDSTDTLVFLDEVQERPEIMTMLKYLKEDGRYRYIVSGSMLGVALKRAFSLPIGSIRTIRMYPMDLEEFMWANGSDGEYIDNVREMVLNDRNMPSGIHRFLMDRFSDYLICGGLPQCVASFITHSDAVEVRDMQKEIHRLYSDDASKYDESNRMHTREIYDLIPSNIMNKRKRMFIKDIQGEDHARFSKYKEDFDDLVSSGVVLEAVCCSDPKFRLLESAKRNLLKLYLSDVGILTSILYKYNVKPLKTQTDINLGNVYESFAAMQLSSSGYDLFYCDNKKIGEVDFLVDDYDHLRVIPIEIKSGSDFKSHNALDKLMSSRYAPAYGIVFSNSGIVEYDEHVLYLPIYAMMFLNDILKSGGMADTYE